MDRKSLKNKLVITLTVLVTCFFVFLNSYLSEVTEESLGQEQKITASFTANVSTAFTTYTLFLEQVLVSDKVADRYLAKIYPGLEPRCRYYNSCMLTMKDSIKQTAKSMTAYFAKKTEIQQLDFKISSKSFKEIQKTREDALENRFLSNKDYVKATLNHDGREIKVKLRLKGDRMDHLEHPKKWSFRIKTSGDDHFMGMRVFSLQNPATKAYQYEAIFHDLMRFMGVVAPRYFFVKVSINGDDIGLMAVEENFSKELLESQKRREGVIFKFNEEDFWTGWVRPVLEQKKVEDPELIRLLKNYKDFRTAQIETFQDSVIEKSEVLTTQKEIGIGLMRGVVEERLKPSEVFDAEITGKFLAIPLVFNAFHSFNWINQRYYLNPVTLKLEPISFDGNLTDVAVISELYNDKTPEGWPQTIEESFGFEFTKLLLADPAIKQATIRALQDLKSKFETTDLQNGLAKIDQQYLRVLQTEFLLLPAYAFGPLARVNETIAEINKMDLSFEVDNEELFVEIPQDLELPRIIQANIVKSGENTFLEVVNMLPTA
ncbi:MAG: CotH kinase family protein, partial [Candidatus Peregrinibacteria bacterium]|nr:CotH kinase family protein [Candidatus Peregrinibacteria bacterium]